MNTTPTYVRIPPWENYAVDIMVEYMQCVDEGLDVERYKTLIEEISKLPIEEEREKMADAMFSLIQMLPVRGDVKYNEPSDYETIKSLCPESVELPAVDRQKLFEKIYGAWMGRICGCLLGKPVEGMRMAQMDSVLKETGNYPVSRYLLKSDMTEEVCEKCPYNLLGRVY
ncbi:MAG: ADP-ribosylglycohydrolase family protein, partial [Clostridia bacterium]|nr:ADP-ribosylglycohydrolase family protein [Clostridia bacterium]